MNTDLASDPAAHPANRIRNGVFAALFLLAYGAVLVYWNGGHPQSVWFYPYIATLALFLGFRVAYGERREDWAIVQARK